MAEERSAMRKLELSSALREVAPARAYNLSDLYRRVNPGTRALATWGRCRYWLPPSIPRTRFRPRVPALPNLLSGELRLRRRTDSASSHVFSASSRFHRATSD